MTSGQTCLSGGQSSSWRARPSSWRALTSRHSLRSTATDLQARLGLKATRLNRLSQRVVVALVLVGIGLREGGQGAIEAVARAEVACDGDRVTGAGVCLRERLSAELGVHHHGGRVHRLDLSRALAVPELVRPLRIVLKLR